MCRGKQLDCHIVQDRFILGKALGSGDGDGGLCPEFKLISWAGTSGTPKYLLVTGLGR